MLSSTSTAVSLVHILIFHGIFCRYLGDEFEITNQSLFNCRSKLLLYRFFMALRPRYPDPCGLKCCNMTHLGLIRVYAIAQEEKKRRKWEFAFDEKLTTLFRSCFNILLYRAFDFCCGENTSSTFQLFTIIRYKSSLDYTIHPHTLLAFK